MGSFGEDVVRLTNDPAVDVDPAWSPDGTQIVFASNRAGSFDLYAMNANGTNVRRLTSTGQDDRHPNWFPNGSLVVFDRSSAGRPANIAFIRPDGSGFGLLTLHPADDREPVWSPDGRSIAFSSDRGGALELYAMEATGASQRPLTSGRAPATGADWQRRVPLDVEYVLPVLAPGTGGRVCTRPAPSGGTR